MSFEKYICWKPEELNSIIRTAADDSDEETFLAIHTNNKIRASLYGATFKKMTYKGFLKDFLKGTHGNNVQTVIEGESGSGKSHLVRWMSLNIPKNDNIIILTIPKTQTNLYSVLKKLISYLPEDEQFKYTEKLTRTETGLTNDSERINEFLSSLARVIERDKPTGNRKDEEQYLIPLLPNLFDDPYFRDVYFNNHPVVNTIISLIFSNSEIIRNSDHRQEFKKEHLPLNAKEATKAALPTQEVLEALLEEDLLKISLEIINRNLDKAITRTLSFSPDDLIQLMSDIRSSLYKKGQELILLIEDFAQLQGVDTALLQVLTVEGTGELCKLKWAMAVTTGYFEKLEDTVRTRMTYKINMDSPWNEKDVENQNKYILQLGSKYLNAIRLGRNNISQWYKKYQEKQIKITNHCDTCSYKDVCHKAFGEVDGIGLYPFNEISLTKMAREADKEKYNVFRPRIFINRVIKRNLNQDMVHALENSQYPPRELYEDFNTEQLAFDEVNKLTKIDPINYSRRETLLELWSNTTILANLDEAIHTAFSLPLLSDITQVVTPTHEIVTTVNPVSPVPTPEVDEHIKNIEQWGRGKELHHLTVNRLRPFIYNAIINYIDWSFVSVAKSMNILKQANIYFASPNTNWNRPGFALKIEQSTEMAIILKTFNYMNKEKDIPKDIASFAKLQEQVKIWSEYLVSEIEKEYASKENWNPGKAAIELLTLGSIIADKKPTINSLFIKDLEYSKPLAPSFNLLISKISSSKDRVKLFQEILEKTFTGKKGGSKTSAFIDVQQVLPVISQLKKNNWRLLQDPAQESIRKFSDPKTKQEFSDLKAIYMQWQTDFDNALTEELIARYKWLDELTNRIAIDDIGIKFKNQIKKLRELASELGVPGHRSIQLDNALLCNLAQVKTAMETTQKLQELPSTEVFSDLFPSRREDAELFIKLIILYEEMLGSITSELNSRLNELNRRTGLSTINLEIETSMNKIKQSFKTLTGEDNAS